MKIARVAARLLIGGLFVGHGLQKLTGAFDGPGIEGTESMMDKIGMHPPRANAYAAGVTEAAGGAMFAVGGAAAPLGGAALVGTMITAIRKVHAPNGPWVTKGGYEYNVVLISAVAAIIEDEHGIAATLGALGLGAAASAAAVELGKPAATAPSPTDLPSAPSSESEAAAQQGDTGTVTTEPIVTDSAREDASAG